VEVTDIVRDKTKPLNTQVPVGAIQMARRCIVCLRAGIVPDLEEVGCIKCNATLHDIEQREEFLSSMPDIIYIPPVGKDIDCNCVSMVQLVSCRIRQYLKSLAEWENNKGTYEWIQEKLETERAYRQKLMHRHNTECMGAAA